MKALLAIVMAVSLLASACATVRPEPDLAPGVPSPYSQLVEPPTSCLVANDLVKSSIEMGPLLYVFGWVTLPAAVGASLVCGGEYVGRGVSSLRGHPSEESPTTENPTTGPTQPYHVGPAIKTGEGVQPLKP